MKMMGQEGRPGLRPSSLMVTVGNSTVDSLKSSEDTSTVESGLVVTSASSEVAVVLG